MTTRRIVSDTSLQKKPSRNTFIPRPVKSIEATGLPPLWLQDLALKILYFQGYMSGFKVAEEIALPFKEWLTRLWKL